MEQPLPTRTAAEMSRLIPEHYALERLIGVGGMAEVYAATDIRHGRTVAVKVMRPEIALALGPERFLREISIVSKLAHPNIAPLYDSAQAGPLLYYVMPYVEGRSLRERIAKEIQLPLDDALRITLEVAEALVFAHGRGVLHRDIKPENILLEAGHALVTDFGIARAIDAADPDRITSAGIAVGTPAYMSPEQASGQDPVDERTDQYALALVLYEMLGGSVPFAGATPAAVLARKILGEYPPLGIIRPSVPDALDQAIQRALAPVPADRFRSITDFTAALRASTTGDQPRKSIRTRLGLVVTLALILALAAIGGRVWWVQRPDGAAGLRRVVVAPLENRTGVPSLDPVGVMAADWITEGLQQTGLVEVVPTPTAIEANRYVAADTSATGPREPLQALAEVTGAATVVGGSFYQQGDRLHFRIDVVDQGGSRLAGALTDISTPVSDPIQGVQELRARLMGWLAVRYDQRLRSPADGGERPPTYAAYVAFSEAMNRYIAVENARALPLFLRAYQADSSFTTALLYASICLTNLDQWARADSLLQQADRRRERMSEYHRSLLDSRLGLVRGDHEAALAAIREAARLAPESKAVYNYATHAFQAGHVAEALEALRSLPAERGPMQGFFPYWDMYGAILHAAGQYDQEYAVGTRARQSYPEFFTGFAPLARALAVRGRFDDLARVVREAEGVPVDPIGWDYGDLLLDVAEELDAHSHGPEAEAYFERALAWLETSGRPRSRPRRVKALYALGRWEQALDLLAALRPAEPANVEYLGMTGLLYARTGRVSQAAAVADTLARSVAPYQFGAPLVYRARIAAALGDPAGAVERLREAFARGAAYDLWLHRDPAFQSLRGYPAYERILEGRR